MEAYMGQKNNAKLSSTLVSLDRRNVFSGEPASNRSWTFEVIFLLLWKLESTLFLPHVMVCPIPLCLYLQVICHCALGAGDWD
jgi:hypothetical protein